MPARGSGKVCGERVLVFFFLLLWSFFLCLFFFTTILFWFLGGLVPLSCEKRWTTVPSASVPCNKTTLHGLGAVLTAGKAQGLQQSLSNHPGGVLYERVHMCILYRWNKNTYFPLFVWTCNNCINADLCACGWRQPFWFLCLWEGQTLEKVTLLPSWPVSWGADLSPPATQR